MIKPFWIRRTTASSAPFPGVEPEPEPESESGPGFGRESGPESGHESRRERKPGPGGASAAPPRWAAGLVAMVLVLAAVLAGTGTPIGVVLEVLAGAGYIGTEIVRRLDGA